MATISKNALSIIETAMTKKEINLFNNDAAYLFIDIIRNKPLKRWGNICRFSVTSSDGTIGRNNLVSSAWNYDENKAWDEACQAIDYFIYGDNDEYDVFVTVIAKGDHPYYNWEQNVDKETAEKVLTESFGTKTEIDGDGFVITLTPFIRTIRWETSEEITEYNLDNLKSRHRGKETGCFFTEWE